ncbi:LysR family transcriptional regulator [Motilimonas cestriensis]|uniref:LysR family transcriptional regulator n=1 Tax=Motilimonas cestriensis TaxID=2742685 RepID=A0ABS8WAG4_9GAMM|nr:LysR substrate-binding domain-containing protein [Motilimonas cestriensis]MCE2595092.1 LysR family transcriptional regulator [Motilimonas cestriensis]
MQLQLRNLDLNLLTLFVTVMEQQNVSKAAKKLNMSQPAMSLGLNRLRKKFNDDLFYRSGGLMQPTTLAKSLYQPINDALKTIGHALPQDDNSENQVALDFNLAMQPALESLLLTKVLAHLHQVSPNIRLKNQYQMDLDALKYNRLDFLIGTQQYQGDELYSEQLTAEPFILAYNCAHPRMQQGMSLAAILAEDFAIVDPEIGLNNDEKMKVKYQVNSYQAALSLVAQTNVLTIIPKSCLDNSEAKRLINWQYTPFSKKHLDVYLTWLALRKHDNSHQWLREVLLSCSQPNKLSAVSA